MLRSPQTRTRLFQALADISPLRMGDANYGSPIWADVEEMSDEQEEIPGYYQIFGHTQLRRPFIRKYFACLDCREAFLLNESGAIKCIS